MKRLNLLVLRCRDLEATRAFYETFEMEFTMHAHGAGPEHYAHEDERGVFELYPVPEGSPPDNVALGFDVGDLSCIRDRLVQLGYLPEPIRDNPWGRTFVVRDPDRRRVEIKESPGERKHAPQPNSEI
jgi:catechol 2,3-dioxygenase-like lactoylglutathione lyase family enzyme